MKSLLFLAFLFFSPVLVFSYDIWTAAEKCDIEALKNYFEKTGGSIDMKNKAGFTPLLSVLNANINIYQYNVDKVLETVNYLLYKKADPNIKINESAYYYTKYPQTAKYTKDYNPLVLAISIAYEGHDVYPIIESLIKYKANLNDKVTRYLNADEVIFLKLGSEAKLSTLTIIQYCALLRVEKSEEAGSYWTEEEFKGYDDLCRILRLFNEIQKKNNKPFKYCEYKNKPDIDLAIILGDAKKVKEIVKKGIMPTKYTVQLAKNFNEIEILYYFAKIADESIADELNEDFFSYLEEGNIDKVKEYISCGVNIEMEDDYGNTAICIASENGFVELIKMFIEKKADFNHKNSDGMTPLMLAVKEQKLDAVKYLITKKAEIKIESGEGLTAYDYSKQGDNKDIEAILEEIYHQDDNFFLAIENGDEGKIKEFIKKGIDVNVVKNDINGNSAISAAVTLNEINILKLLISSKADINKKNKYGNTPLIIASENGNIDIVKMLLKSKADVNITNNFGSSALIMATQYCKTEVVQLLLKANADKSIKNLNNETALDCAKNNDYKEIIELIEKSK